MGQQQKVTEGIANLETLTRSALAAKWHAVMNTPPPKASSRIFLQRALSYELQSRHMPGLSKADSRLLSASLSKDLHFGAEVSRQDLATKRRPPARVRLVPGARLVREWNAKTYTISVIDEGFVYKNKTWNSLSAIAKDITGAHWSGPRFFGLNKGG